MDINEVIKMALQKSLKAKSTEIDAGSYDLDGTRVIIDLSGKLSKGEAEWHTPTTSIPTIATLALAFKLLGIQRERFMETLEVAMNAALANDDQAEEYVKVFNADYSRCEEKVRQSLKALPKVRHEGKVYTKDVEADVVINAGPALVASALVGVP